MSNNFDYSFTPNKELRERLEANRQEEETTSELLIRLIEKGLGEKPVSIKYKLPLSLKHLEAIAQPVLELFASFYEIKEIHSRSDLGQWKITDKGIKKSCYLFVTEACEWTLESLNLDNKLPICFDFDVHEWCDNNEIHIDELYESLAD